MISVKVLANCRVISTLISQTGFISFRELTKRSLSSPISDTGYSCHLLLYILSFRPQMEGKTPEFHGSQQSRRLGAVYGSD